MPAESAAVPASDVDGRAGQLRLLETTVDRTTSARRDIETGLCAWLFARLTQLERPWRGHLVLAVALLLVSPTLLSGLAFDDYLFVYQTNHPARNEWAGSSPFDLFRWVDAAHEPRLLDGQGLPWWSYERTSVAFMRPVSSLTHALDHWLWPHSAFGMHLQSLLWFACMLLVAGRAYSALNESRFVAALASAMFAVDSAHGAAVGWISNRNALVGGIFGIGALLLHHRHRSGAGRPFALLACCCFALGLLSTEAAIGSVGYLVAYALCFERGPWRSRLASLLPYAAISALWVVARRDAHYGVVGLGGYLDPIKEPLEFLQMLPQRALVLIASQVARLAADLFDWAPMVARPLLLICALVCCAGALWAAWPRLRSDRGTRFWTCGAVLSALPLTAAVPSDRLLTLVGLGVMPVLACIMKDALRPSSVGSVEAQQRRAATLRRDIALALAFVHLIVDPVLLPVLALLPSVMASSAQALETSLPSAPALRDQTVIVAQIPDSWMLSYLPVMRSVNGKPRPDKLHWLLATQEPTRFERLGPNRLRVTCAKGFFDAHWFERNSHQPLHRGDRIQLSEMTVTVIEVSPDGRPVVCDFAFLRPLESSKYVWLTWHEGRLAPFQVPPPPFPAHERSERGPRTPLTNGLDCKRVPGSRATRNGPAHPT
jgi:hypothetical protein